jgi:predicted metal-binding protein
MILPMQSGVEMHGDPPDRELNALVDLALRLGATGAAVVSAKEIRSAEALARLCREPRCRNYGISGNCPPHVAGPAYFRELQRNFDDALAVKIDVPTEFLLSDERRDIMVLLHQIVTGVERRARDAGFHRAAAFAGGACKELFCADHGTCRVIDDGGPCRNPHVARPSMSGFGIDVSGLMRLAGWSGETIFRDKGGGEPGMSWVAGLVLVR